MTLPCDGCAEESPRLTAYATGILRSHADAQDVVQDVFVRAWRQGGESDQRKGTASAWLLAMVRSRSIEVLRARRAIKRQVVIDATAPTAMVPDAPERDYGILHASVALLPEAQRVVVDLAYFDGLSHVDIARPRVSRSGPVKTRLRKAVQTLRLTVARASLDRPLQMHRRAGLRPLSPTLIDRVLGPLADLYFIDVVVPGGRIQRTEWGHVNPDIQDDLNQVWRFVPPAKCDSHPVRQVIGDCRELFVPHTSTQWMSDVVVSLAHRAFLERLRLQSLICQPITAQGRVLGTLSVARTAASGAQFGERDLEATRQVAAHFGAALLRAPHAPFEVTANPVRDAVHRPHMSGIERGVRRLSVVKLAQIARAPGVPVRNYGPNSGRSLSW